MKERDALRSRISELEEDNENWKLSVWLYREEMEDQLDRISQLEQENATLIAMQAWYEGEMERLREGIKDVCDLTDDKIRLAVVLLEMIAAKARSILETQPKGDEEDE